MHAGTTHHSLSIGSLRVPPVALGTMYFGTRVDAGTAFACMDEASELGVTLWDTANNYAFWAGGTGDESETVLGDWFRARGAGARDRIVVATKIGARPLAGHADLDHVQGLSARAVREQAIASLRRLRTDRIDLLYAHLDDPRVELEETLGALNALIDEGMVREIAASNLTAERVAAAASVTIEHPYRALQERFTYLPVASDADTSPQVVLDAAIETAATTADMTLVGYSPLLSGAYTRADRPVPSEYRTPRAPEQLALLRRVAEQISAPDRPIDAGQVVLAWMMQRSTPVLPIVGVSRPEQVGAAWHAVTHALPADVLAQLDASRR